MAMIGGIVTPPRLIYNEARRDPDKAQYLVSAALICSGLTSLIQVGQGGSARARARVREA